MGGEERGKRSCEPVRLWKMREGGVAGQFKKVDLRRRRRKEGE